MRANREDAPNPLRPAQHARTESKGSRTVDALQPPLSALCCVALRRHSTEWRIDPRECVCVWQCVSAAVSAKANQHRRANLSRPWMCCSTLSYLFSLQFKLSCARSRTLSGDRISRKVVHRAANIATHEAKPHTENAMQSLHCWRSKHRLALCECIPLLAAARSLCVGFGCANAELVVAASICYVVNLCAVIDKQKSGWNCSNTSAPNEQLQLSFALFV